MGQCFLETGTVAERFKVGAGAWFQAPIFLKGRGTLLVMLYVDFITNLPYETGL